MNVTSSFGVVDGEMCRNRENVVRMCLLKTIFRVRIEWNYYIQTPCILNASYMKHQEKMQYCYIL